MASSLVNAALPSDSPRSVHTGSLILGGQNGGTLSMRLVHMLPGVQRAAAPFSRAHWRDLELIFVPSAKLAGVCVSLTVGFHADSTAVASLTELVEMPVCHHFSFGAAGEVPPVFRCGVSFSDAMTSPLVKPPPIEMSRTAFSVHVEFHTVDDSVKMDSLGKIPLIRVYAAGHLEVGGQS